MQFLKGCSKVTLTHLVDAYSEKFLDEKWHSGISLAKIQAHDFNDVFSRTEIKSRNSFCQIYIMGCKIVVNNRSASYCLWIIDDEIKTSAPENWGEKLAAGIKAITSDLIKSHNLKIEITQSPHGSTVISWDAPKYIPGERRSLGINVPMIGKAQIESIVDLIRQSIAAEKATAEEARQSAKDMLIEEIKQFSNGNDLPRIEWEDKYALTSNAKIYLMSNYLKLTPCSITVRYKDNVISKWPSLDPTSKQKLVQHFKYQEISDKQGGMLKISALTAWLYGRPDGGLNNFHTKYFRKVIDEGVVNSTVNKGRIESTYKSDSLNMTIGTISIKVEEQFPETVLLSMKGKPLSALIQIEGVSEHIIITSLKSQNGILVGKVRDQSRLFWDGLKIIDKSEEE